MQEAFFGSSVRAGELLGFHAPLHCYPNYSVLWSEGRGLFAWYFLILGLKHPKVEEQWSIFRHVMKSCQLLLIESLFGFVKSIASKVRTQHCVSMAFEIFLSNA